MLVVAEQREGLGPTSIFTGGKGKKGIPFDPQTGYAGNYWTWDRGNEEGYWLKKKPAGSNPMFLHG